MRLWMPIVVLLLAGCATQRLRKEQAEWLRAFGSQAPPGTIALNDSLYYDRTEIENLGWLEFEFWVMRIHGRGSSEHRALLPDTNVWDQFIAYGEPYMSSYLRHPAYSHYPVVGISYEQAVDYSKWRSDRVMEYNLVKAGIITFRPEQNAGDHFSIERFYATDSLKAFHHLPYPSYGLPTISEWRLALARSDSLARVNLPRCKKLRTSEFRGATFGECSDLVREGVFVINCRKEGSHGADKTAPADCSRCNADLIWQLRGNVAELSADSILVLGGGWTDLLDSILLDQPFPNQAPNAANGFRNVCQWRKWNGLRQ